MSNVQIKLKKSLNGRSSSQIATAHSMGLYKIDDCTIQPKNNATDGKIRVIAHMVETQDVD